MLRVSLLQLDLIWENPKENIQKINSLLPKKDTTDVVILPEMFTTGFTMHPKKCGHQNDAEVIHMMHTWAEQSNALVIGSAAVKTTNSDKYFNRLFAVTPSGKTHHYDKRHLFQMSN